MVGVSPLSTKRRHPEDDLAKAVAETLHVVAPRLLFWHVPNGGKRNAREAARLKAQGVRSGVADLQFILDDGTAAFIELKVEGTSQTETQKLFQADIEARGLDYVVCRSVDEVLETLRDWGAALRVSNRVRNERAT